MPQWQNHHATQVAGLESEDFVDRRRVKTFHRCGIDFFKRRGDQSRAQTDISLPRSRLIISLLPVTPMDIAITQRRLLPD